MIVHVQTVIQATFGILDEAGNVNPQPQISLTMATLSPEAFAQAYQVLMQAREQMQARAVEPKAAKPPER